jgi:hypothetical protein
VTAAILGLAVAALVGCLEENPVEVPEADIPEGCLEDNPVAAVPAGTVVASVDSLGTVDRPVLEENPVEVPEADIPEGCLEDNPVEVPEEDNPEAVPVEDNPEEGIPEDNLVVEILASDNLAVEILALGKQAHWGRHSER